MQLSERIARKIFSSPRKSILVPAAVTFTIGYPLLYSIISGIGTSITEYAFDTRSGGAIYIKQALIFSADKSALDFILPQLESLPGHDHQIMDAVSSSMSLPFLFIKNNYSLADLSSDIELIPSGSNDFSQDATGQLLAYVYENTTATSVWDDLFISESTVSSSSIAAYSSLPGEWLHDEITAYESNHHVPTSASTFRHTTLISKLIIWALIGYSTLAAFMLTSFSNTSAIRSKSGLLFAYVVQLILSFSSAGAVVRYFYPFFSVSRMDQMLIMLFMMLSPSIEGVFRFLRGVGKLSIGASSLSKIISGANGAWKTSLKNIFSDAVIISVIFVPAFGFSDNFRACCILVLFVIFFDFALHVTYFTAVTSVDLRRCDFESLIMSDYDASLDDACTLPSNQSNSLAKLKPGNSHTAWKLRLGSYLFFRYDYLRRNGRFLSTVLCLFYLWITSSTSSTESPVGVCKTLFPEILVKTAENNAVFKYSRLIYELLAVYKRPLKIFEPIITQFWDESKLFNQRLAKSPSYYGVTTNGLCFHLTGTFFAEFIACLSFVLSLSSIIMMLFLPAHSLLLDEELKPEIPDTEYSFKYMSGYHTLDVLQIVANGRWLASLSLDKKIFVWRPSANSSRIIDVHEIPVSNDFWPVNKLVLNGQHHMIAIFSAAQGTIKVWNFGKSYVNYYYKHPLFKVGINVVGMYFLGKELVVVTRQGLMLVINDVGDSQIFNIYEQSENLSTIDEAASLKNNHVKDFSVVSTTRLATPRMHEQIVCLTNKNGILVAVHVGKTWRFRKLQLFETVSASSHLNGRSEEEMHANSKYSGAFGGNSRRNVMSMPTQRPLKTTGNYRHVIALSQLNMVIITSNTGASLLDALSGVVVKHFHLGNYLPGSLRVLHSQPTHCRFCGCISVESISVCYSDFDDPGTVIVDTLQIENRSKNTICLRVERDPREVRCLGFEAAIDRQHWIRETEAWDTTDINMIMGVQKMTERPEMKITEKASVLDWFISKTTKLFFKLAEQLTPLFDQRQVKRNSTNSAWEGWSVSATGHTSYYNIPFDQLNEPVSGLLIKKAGPATKFGHRSIAVGFGNQIKVLYFGNEEIQTALDDTISYRSASVNGSIRRRKNGSTPGSYRL